MRAKRPNSTQQNLEGLESRRLLTVFTVTNTADSGAGSLRWAMMQAYNTPGVDTIAFNITASDKTIRPTSALPIVYDPTIIDGTTQPGYVGLPLVRIDGAQAGATDGIELFGNCILQGLCITGFNGQGVTTIPIAGSGYSGNVIRHNWIGVDLTGRAAPNQSNDLGIYSPRNVIDGNVLGSSVAGDGIWMMGGIFNSISDHNLIESNIIGLDPTGRRARGTIDGIGIQDSPNDAILGNIIGNQRDDAILVRGSSRGIVIQGNRLGTDKTGTVAMPDGLYGIEDQSDHGMIGGLRTRQRNIIAANAKAGIVFWLSGAHDNLVENNYIGTDNTGLKPLGNGEQGIAFSDAGPNTIGGTSPAARNIISANGHEGVGIFPGSGEIIQGNWIGLDAAGRAMPNGTWGVTVIAGSTNCIIGGSGQGEANTIISNPNGAVWAEFGDTSEINNITVLRNSRRR